MSTIGTNAEDLILNADGSGSDIKFKSNGTEVGSISDGGVMTATSFAGSGASLTGIEGVPTGVIAMWHGASSAIPSGWVICDGNNSTPNLTDKFIKSTGTANQTGGGTTTGAHTLSIAEMPAHTHSKNYTPGSAAAYAAAARNSFFDGASGVTSSTGGGGSHTHTQAEPVYYSLIFIMKT
jgi:microcystin-dependent protein